MSFRKIERRSRYSFVDRRSQEAIATLLFSILAVLTVALFILISKPAYAETYGVLSDTHIGKDSNPTYADCVSNMKESASWVKKHKPSLIIHAGDVTISGKDSEYSQYNSLYKSIFGKTPSITTMGNHDAAGGGAYHSWSKNTLIKNFKITSKSGELDFKEMKKANIISIGRCYYNKGYNLFPASDAKWLNEKLLKTARAGKWAIIVCHYPFSAHQWSHKSALKRFKQVAGSYPNVVYLYGHLHHFNSSDNMKSRSFGKMTNPYAKNRQGHKTSKRYAIHSIPIWSSLQNRAGSVISANDGKLSFSEYIPKHGTSVNRSLKKLTGTVSITAKGSGGAKGTAQLKVTFSDGKKHGKINNGQVVKISIGKTKKISDIPSGVLVTAAPVATSGLSTPKAQAIEAYDKARTMTFTFDRTYTVQYSGNGATSGKMAASTMRASKAVNLAANQYKKTGYTFQGWSLKSNGSVKYANSAKVKNITSKNSITLYAVWKALPAQTITTPVTPPPTSTPTSTPTTITSIKYGWAALDANKKTILRGSQYEVSSRPVAYIWNGVTTVSVNKNSVVYLNNTQAGTAQVLIIGDKLVGGYKDAFITQFTVVKQK